MARILLVPGFMQRGDAWAPLLERLPDARPLDHRTHDFEGRLAEIAEAGEGALLCGYSLGGRLALRAALRDGPRYRGVITIGASPGIEEPAVRSARAEADDRLAGWMETMPIEEIVAVWERQPLFADQGDALVEAQREGRLGHGPRELALLLRTAGQGALDPVWIELETLVPPLLAVAGVRDEAYAAAAERMAATAPRGRFALVEHAGHAAHLQRPDEVAGLIAAFGEELA
ncbi:MAG: alpha/beta fold hydrolase [Thermoleophilaceae bacterium]|nr:alpha/beta fold hydrolase [Thermoleophilaceae bacterium]